MVAFLRPVRYTEREQAINSRGDHMLPYTPQQARYFAEQITLQRSESSVDGLASAMSGVKVDLKPHQVDAALFALNSPLRNGALLADEVGLGKTIEAEHQTSSPTIFFLSCFIVYLRLRLLALIP